MFAVGLRPKGGNPSHSSVRKRLVGKDLMFAVGLRLS